MENERKITRRNTCSNHGGHFDTSDQFLLTLRPTNNMGKEREFNVIIERGEDGYYLSEIVELPGCHTQAKTMDQLIQRTKEAIELYLEATKETVKESFIGVQRIKVAIS